MSSCTLVVRSASMPSATPTPAASWRMTASSAFSSTSRSCDSIVPTQPVGMKRFANSASRWPLLFFVPDKPSTPTATITTPASASVANSLAFTEMLKLFMLPPIPSRLGRPAQRGCADQSGYIENQRDRAVAEDRGPRDAVDATEIRFQRLDDHLLLAEQVVDEQADAAAVAFHDHDQAFVQLGRLRAHAEHLVQAHDRHVAVAEREHFLLAGNAIDAAGLELQRFDDRDQRHDVGLAADRHRLAVDDRERQRQRDDEARAPAERSS